MKEDPTISAFLVPYAATILAYVFFFNLPIMVAAKPIQVFMSTSCSTVAVVFLFRGVLSGPIWARILTGLVMLPLLIHIVFTLWSGSSGVLSRDKAEQDMGDRDG